MVIVLLIFGPGKLPELGRAMGDGLRELKKATGGDDHKDADTAAATATVTPIAAARTCPSCRGAIKVDDRFCGNCGASTEPATRTA